MSPFYHHIIQPAGFLVGIVTPLLAVVLFSRKIKSKHTRNHNQILVLVLSSGSTVRSQIEKDKTSRLPCYKKQTNRAPSFFNPQSK